MSKKQTAPNRYKLALILSAEPDGATFGASGDRETGRIEARAAVIDTTKKQRDETEAGDWEVTSFCYGDENKHLRDLDGFRFFGWFHRDTLQAYGDRPQFQAGSFCDLEDVTRYNRVLTAIHKKLERMNESRGYAVDVADYCGRVAEAVGADCFTVAAPKGQAEWESGYKNRCLTIGEGVNWLRRRLEELRIKTAETANT